jgi:hypothetical protein
MAPATSAKVLLATTGVLQLPVTDGLPVAPLPASRPRVARRGGDGPNAPWPEVCSDRAQS